MRWTVEDFHFGHDALAVKVAASSASPPHSPSRPNRSYVFFACLPYREKLAVSIHVWCHTISLTLFFPNSYLGEPEGGKRRRSWTCRNLALEIRFGDKQTEFMSLPPPVMSRNRPERMNGNCGGGQASRSGEPIASANRSIIYVKTAWTYSMPVCKNKLIQEQRKTWITMQKTFETNHETLRERIFNRIALSKCDRDGGLPLKGTLGEGPPARVQCQC